MTSPPQRMAVLDPFLEGSVPLARAAAAAGVPERTARRWLAEYRAEGPRSLTRSARSDRGKRRTAADVVALVEGLALGADPPSMAQMHRQAVQLADERGVDRPSYSTVRRLVAALDPGLLCLAHDGPVAYRDRFELALRRESARPNQLWQADHTELDIMVVDPAGRPARPWLSVILDDHSRAVPGYTPFLGDPSALQTALALHQAIWRKADPAWPLCGLPDTLYSDHGSDFTSLHLEQVCHDTGIELVHSQAGRPQGRGKVERFFGTVTQELLPTLPGWIPHGRHGKPVTKPALTLAQLDAAIGAFIVTDYHQRVHSETGQPPVRRWLADGWLPRMPDSLEQLDLLLLTVATPRKVHRDGVHCHGLRYLDLTLAAYVGESVVVRYDPRDLAEIRLYHKGAFLCRAVAPELAEATISLKDLQAARAARRRDLGEELRSRRSLADALSANTTVPIPPGTELTPRTPAPEAVPPPRRPGLRTYQTD